MDALTEGAYPVYAVAAEGAEVIDEDVSAQTGTLASTPVSEDADEVTFEIDGEAQETVRVFTDPADADLDAGQTAYNPVTGDYAHDAVPTSGNATYSHYDYASAVATIEADRAEVVDFIGILTETDAVVQAAHDAALRMAANYNFAVAVAGAASHITDKGGFTNSYDSSRIQLLYPSRNAAGESIVGSYLGLRAALGINNSPMFKRLQTQNRLSETLAKSEQESLIVKKVVPVANDSRGARIVEDLTCVADDNTEEDAMRQVLHRLIIDYVTEITNEVSEKYIGELHTQAARNSLRSNIVARLGGLMDMNAITAYVVTVEPVDAMTASVDVGVSTINPLRNINATVTAGAVA
ncbi:hypothetical protein HTZ84_09515 [Haloterrigena sp. SYSU A558-1]|uniref:Phage tail sheath protein n=1 Tax=Haloterrigena gelatinilytica TaxID=2741724 RepID=A0ABX2LDW5_9EURY|nr:hypothetical protein [Haloterrigena gelatinilytica]NUC72543.1 hypothetical protein [Haloterrigena gelatinilytica]